MHHELWAANAASNEHICCQRSCRTHNIPASRLTVRWHGKYKNTVPKPAIDNSLFHDSIFPLVSNLAKIKNVNWGSGDYWNNTKYKNKTFFDAADSINFFTNYLDGTPDDHLLKFTVSKKPKPSVSIFHLVRPNISKLGFVTSDNYSSEMFNSSTQKTNDAVSFHKKIREPWELHYKYLILSFFLGSFSIVMLGLAYMRFTKHHN